jgi:RNA polymerase sigma-70 factor (ECF subfamily)
MPRNPSFDDLMARLRDGQNEAAAQVFNRFANRLIVLARKQLDPQIRQKVDPEDVMQSVFRSFFLRNATGQLGEFDTWDNLWALLVVMTQRKCGRRIDYFHTARRDVDREVPAMPPADQSTSDPGISAEEPTPLEAAMLTETVEQLMSSLQGRQRQILTLSLQGCTAAEISTELGCTERTVYRVLERVKEWLEARGDDQQ